MIQESLALLAYAEKPDCHPAYRRMILETVKRNAMYLTEEQHRKLLTLLATLNHEQH